MLKLLKLVCGLLAVGLWFSSYLVWSRFAANGVRSARPDQGRVYPLDTHGSIVYLTSGEHQLLIALMVAAAVFALLAALIHFLGPRN